MAALVIENSTDLQADAREVKKPARTERPPVYDVEDLTADLGIWLAGLDSFFASGQSPFAYVEATAHDAERDFQLSHAALLRCAVINSTLLTGDLEQGAVGGRELGELANVLRDLLVLGDALLAGGSLGPSEWNAWRSTASERLNRSAAYSKLVDNAARNAENSLPPALRAVMDNPENAERAELALILPKFAKVLKWLDVVGRMLRADEPLKPALVIFSSISEQVHDLIDSINNRLERFPDKDAELFGVLDAAAYTSSIELRKVYTQELAGVVELRPSPSIYAKMETAYSLLYDGFQQTLAGMARSLDPATAADKHFPNFAVKRDQSLVLRSDLYALAALVRSAELEPDKKNIEAMRNAVRSFMSGPVRYLFYKDSETFERFVEEIMIAKQNKDLVPILHRFGAYIETLFGQVNLRVVLADHPFEG